MIKRISKKLFVILLVFICTVTMTIPSDSIEKASSKSRVRLNRKSVTLIVGKSMRLKVRGTWRKARWRSGNKSIARVSKIGVVKARKSGKCKIYAKVKGRRAMKCTVTVMTREEYNLRALRNLILRKGKTNENGDKQLFIKQITENKSPTRRKTAMY